MKKYVKAIGMVTALAVMIPLSAHAATSTANSAKTVTPTMEMIVPKGMVEGHWGHGKHGMMGQDVLDLLKLDRQAFLEKIQAGKTLAQIAEEQGVSREALKKAMTESFNKRLEQHRKHFADNLDKMIDSKQYKEFNYHRRSVFILDGFTEAAKVLGLTTEQVKEGLMAGKSLADLAAEKKVDVQKLIDAQKNAIVKAANEAVKAGKLTREQADMQLADAEAMAEKIVNAKGFGHKSHHGGRFHGH